MQIGIKYLSCVYFRALAKGKEVMDRGDPLRGRSRLYLEQLRAQVNHRFSLARHRRRHGDVVLEDPLPNIGTLMLLCGEMVPAQRPLKPTRIERKKVLMQDMTNQDIKILLSVVRAYDVPVRSDQDPMNQGAPTDHYKADGVLEASVYSFIEAQFQVYAYFKIRIMYILHVCITGTNDEDHCGCRTQSSLEPTNDSDFQVPQQRLQSGNVKPDQGLSSFALV